MDARRRLERFLRADVIVSVERRRAGCDLLLIDRLGRLAGDHRRRLRLLSLEIGDQRHRVIVLRIFRLDLLQDGDGLIVLALLRHRARLRERRLRGCRIDVALLRELRPGEPSARDQHHDSDDRGDRRHRRSRLRRSLRDRLIDRSLLCGCGLRQRDRRFVRSDALVVEDVVLLGGGWDVRRLDRRGAPFGHCVRQPVHVVVRRGIRRIEPQRLGELRARRVAIVAIECLHAGGDDRLDLLIGLALLRFRALDPLRGLIVRDVDQKDARPEIDGLLKLAGIECAIAVGEVLIDFLLVVRARLDRCSGEIELARAGHLRRCGGGWGSGVEAEGARLRSRRGRRVE